MATITINKDNFCHNLNQIALKTGSIDKIAIVLKDNAYGHGLEIMAQLASEFGIRHAVVKNRDEADVIRGLFRTVLILGGQAVPDETCTYAINTLDDIEKAQKGSRVELKVDTGMHRNGIAIDDLDRALERIVDRELVLFGLMTHFRSADEPGSEFFWQKKQFEYVKTKVKAAGFTGFRMHSHNSAAILRSKSFEEDLVRVGIGAYGYNELPESFDKAELKPVLSLYARKIATKRLKKGDRVGYGGDFEVPCDMQVSTYDLGYGDGWCRGDSCQPYLTAEDLPVLGRVSMDFVSIASQKEVLCIMNDAQSAAKQFGTISYEITTALSPLITRSVL